MIVDARHTQEATLIRPEGTGDYYSATDTGYPIMITANEAGELELIVWADINQQDPTHTISLEKAKESNRKRI